MYTVVIDDIKSKGAHYNFIREGCQTLDEANMAARRAWHRNQDKDVYLIDHEGNQATAVKRVEDLIGFVMEQNGELVEYDEALVRKLIEKVIIYDEQIKVVFKSGIDVDIKA